MINKDEWNEYFKDKTFKLEDTTNFYMIKYKYCKEMRLSLFGISMFILMADNIDTSVRENLGFRTSVIKDIFIFDGDLNVATENSVYRFKEVE